VNDAVMLEAALFQLRTGAEDVDAIYAPQLELSLSVLAHAVAAARDGLNAARVSDIEFALNDLAAAIDELPASDADRLAGPLQMMRGDLERMKEASALDAGVIAQIRALQAKLRARRAAIERQTFVEGGDPAPLPHSPEQLRADALPLRDALAASGFATPALDALIEEPEGLRFHGINEIFDELDVIAG
jgi:hypothetical protein